MASIGEWVSTIAPAADAGLSGNCVGICRSRVAVMRNCSGRKLRRRDLPDGRSKRVLKGIYIEVRTLWIYVHARDLSRLVRGACETMKIARWCGWLKRMEKESGDEPWVYQRKRISRLQHMQSPPGLPYIYSGDWGVQDERLRTQD